MTRSGRSPEYLIRRWHVHDEIALFIGTAIVVALLITLFDGVLVRGFFAGASAVFQPQNALPRRGIAATAARKIRQPSIIGCRDTLGYQGRIFVVNRAARRRLSQLNGRPAKEPIRMYAGLAHRRPDDKARVNVSCQ